MGKIRKLWLLLGFILTRRFLTDEAVGGGRARVGFESGHLCPLQEGAEARVAGFPGEPAQAAVGEGGHVLPAPVGHVDLPQAHPGGQTLQGGRTALLCASLQLTHILNCLPTGAQT